MNTTTDNTCGKCAQPVESSSAITAFQRSWHKECFKCANCNQTPLGSVSLNRSTNEIWCKPCADEAKERQRQEEERLKKEQEEEAAQLEQQQSTCAVCGKQLEGHIVEIFGNFFHLACYSCCSCGKRLEPSDLALVKDGLPICSPCGSKKLWSSKPLTTPAAAASVSANQSGNSGNPAAKTSVTTTTAAAAAPTTTVVVASTANSKMNVVQPVATAVTTTTTTTTSTKTVTAAPTAKLSLKDLDYLEELKDKGVITQAEFDNKEAQVLGSSKLSGAAGSAKGALQDLERLYDLKSKGILSEDEFASKKKQILNSI